MSNSPSITINKLIRPEYLAHSIQQHDDLLCVTHDYFQSVTSKTKLMELTAQLSQNVRFIIFRKILSLWLHSSMIISEWLILRHSSIRFRKAYSRKILMLHLSDQIFRIQLNSWLCFIIPRACWKRDRSMCPLHSTLK